MTIIPENLPVRPKRRFSLVPQLDRYPWAVRFAQTLPGKLFLLALFSLLLAVYWPEWVVFIALCLGFCLFFPGRRHVILVAASLLSIVIGRTDLHRENIDQLWAIFGVGQSIGTAHFFLSIGLVLYLCYLIVRFSKPRAGGRTYIGRPILTVLAAFLVLAGMASYAPIPPYAKGIVWGFLIIFNKYLWFLSYSLCESHDQKSPPFYRQLGYYLPFWHPVNLPIPKGAAYIRRIRADTPEDLAIYRLKGLKLLNWAVYLSIFTLFLKAVCFGFGETYSKLFTLVVDQGTLLFFFQEELVGRVNHWPLFLDIPSYKEAVEQCIAGRPFPFYINWLALILHFFLMILHLAIVTHAAIAICRMAGYKALRNVYRPLTATTIAGFWNNYYYYYKELMVTVFFYPTFLRYFKNRHYLRYYAATMAAAGLGNFLYHFLLRLDLMITRGVFETFLAMQSMAFYCFLLGNGIFLSQLRKLKGASNSVRIPPPLATAGVILFYCVIMIFGDPDYLFPLADNFRFLLSLFNLIPSVN